MDGQQVGLRTSAIDEKCQAFETLVTDLLFYARRTVRIVPVTEPGGGAAIVTIRSS